VAGGEIVVLDLADGSVTLVAGPGQEAAELVWSRDGGNLYFTAGGGTTAVSSRQLWSVEARAGATPRLLTEGVPFCVGAIVRPDGWDDLLLLAQSGTGTNLLRFSVAGGTTESLVEFAHDASGLSASAAGLRVAVVASTPERAPEVYTAQTEPGSSFARITDLHANLGELDLGPQEVFNWERVGFELDGILIWPPGKSRADGRLPLIVSIHGGPYGRWAHGFLFNRFGRWLAQQGYLVFLPNPRGGSGHGQAFAESVLHTVGNDDYLDIMDGVDRLVAQGVADPERLGLGGWSQGGFMTAWIVGHSTRFKAGIMGAGVSDWGMMIATSDIPAYEQLMGGGNPYEGVGPHTFDAQSPISFLSNVTTPVLVAHGEKDERVPLSQGTFFHRGLLRYGVPTELVVYPREPHGILERQHQIDLAERMAAWFRCWIPTE
jgi:dipeptidyl aminopeptidase/acylaminoacyl peptidase